MITLKDKLSHLSYVQACKLLGPLGKQLILEGGKYDLDLFEQVTLNNRRFSLSLEDAKVEIALDPKKHQRLNINCSTGLGSGCCSSGRTAIHGFLQGRTLRSLAAYL